MEELFLPVLSHFQNGNAWSGSGRRLRYRLVPDGETIAAEVWEGPFCYELSAVEERRDFPLSQEGLDALRDWIGQWDGVVNARPPKTLAETIQQRADR